MRHEIDAEVSWQLEGVKHWLWDGNVDEVFERLTNLLMDWTDPLD